MANQTFFANYPTSGAAGASNPSVGTNTGAAPSFSTEIGFIDASGNLQGVSPTNPLPITIESEVGTLNVNVSEYGGVVTSLGQKTSLASQPVVIASDQSTLPISAVSLPLPTGAATSANQSTQITSLASILANQTNGTQETVIVGTVPLPTGAATASLQTTGNTSLSSIDTKTPALGQALAAASVPVVLTAAQITALTPPTSVTVNRNTNGQVTNSTSIGTSAVTFTPPTNAVGFVIEAESANAVNLRYACGTTATTTAGMLLEPGRDSGYIPSSATVTVCAVSGSAQSASIQWVMSS